MKREEKNQEVERRKKMEKSKYNRWFKKMKEQRVPEYMKKG